MLTTTPTAIITMVPISRAVDFGITETIENFEHGSISVFTSKSDDISEKR